jgi:DNA-binding CsgD family transcriptional regulator
MAGRSPNNAEFLSHVFIHKGRLRNLRRAFIISVSNINHPLFRAMNKTATVLSDREMEILGHVSKGRSNKQIADELGLSVHTVANHRKNMLSRSRCATCPELVRVAMEERLI